MRKMRKPPAPIGSQILILLAFLLPASDLCQTYLEQVTTSTPEPLLRLSETTRDVAADLDRFVPEYMHEQDIPGVSIALVRDGVIAWRKGYGVADTITRESVTEQTPFEVASNSKVIAAYIFLRLVDQGKLELDRSLNLPVPKWPAVEPSTAGTRRTMAADLARFLLKVADPQHQCGFVVCTNNDLLNPDLAIRIAHRALGGKIESILQASHLRFNYRPPTESTVPPCGYVLSQQPTLFT
jgi:hypothetical protein